MRRGQLIISTAVALIAFAPPLIISYPILIWVSLGVVSALLLWFLQRLVLGVISFPSLPHEAESLKNDIREAVEGLREKGALEGKVAAEIIGRVA